MHAVGEAFGRDAIYTTDGGNTSLWAALALPPTRPRSYLNILELGMLGTGIPSAVGAKLGNPDRDVVCVTGDGAAGFHFMEMQSAAREGLCASRRSSAPRAPGRWRCPTSPCATAAPSEPKWARSAGTASARASAAPASYVERLEELAPALERARSSERPTVVCVRTSREANLALPAEALQRFVEVYQGPLG